MEVVPATLVHRLTELQEMGLLVHLLSSSVHYGQLNFQSPVLLSPAQCVLKNHVVQKDSLP